MSLDIVLIRNSFEAVKPVAKPVVDYFYQYLFSQNPSLRHSLFSKVDLEKQKQHLISSLVFIVDNLERSEALEDYLFKLGERHVKYGVQEQHYALIGSSLIATLKHFFKHQWSKELEQSWIAAYGIIAEKMKAGAAQAGSVAQSQKENQMSQQHSKGNASSQKPSEISIESIEKTLSPEIQALIKEEIRNQVRQILANEIELWSRQLKAS